MTLLGNHGVRLILTRPLALSLRNLRDYLGYIILGKNNPCEIPSNLILLLLGKVWVGNGGEGTPSSYWYCHFLFFLILAF